MLRFRKSLNTVVKTWQDRQRLGSLLLWLTVLTCRISSAQMDEYSVKAGYLYNFSKYVTWPDRGLQDMAFTICIFGEDPFEGRLDQAIAGKTSANGQRFEVKRIGTFDKAVFQPCQVVFISKSERSRANQLVDSLKEFPILTVADFESFADRGGVADLRIEGTRVKVDLNIGAATRAGLKISARLQQVAKLVP
jgi:hypothetical protein